MLQSVGAEAMTSILTLEDAAVTGLCPAVALDPDSGMGYPLQAVSGRRLPHKQEKRTFQT